MNVRRCCGIHSLSPARTRAGQHYGAVLSVLAASLGAGAVRLPLRKKNAPAAAAATATITARMVALEGIMASLRAVWTTRKPGYPASDRVQLEIARVQKSSPLEIQCADFKKIVKGVLFGNFEIRTDMFSRRPSFPLGVPFDHKPTTLYPRQGNRSSETEDLRRKSAQGDRREQHDAGWALARDGPSSKSR